MEETFAVDYAQHQLINRKPRLQPTGDALDTISFSMYLHSDFTNPEEDIDILRTSMKNREVLPLILGNGRVLGQFVITGMNKSTSFTDPSGNIIEATVSVELLEAFTEEPLREAGRKAQDRAFATVARNSNVRSVLPPKLSPAMMVTANVSKIDTSSFEAMNFTDEVQKNPATAEYYSGKIDGVMDKIDSGLDSISQALDSGNILNEFQTPEFVTAIGDVYTSIQNIKAVLPISDINSFRVLIDQLRGAVGGMKKANNGLSNQAIIRRV